jgi:hypothetical protein
MKNVTHCLGFLVIFTFCLYLQTASAQSDAFQNVDYCALFDSSKYADQHVKTTSIMFVPKITGNVVDGPSPFFYSPKCNDRDHFAVANFSLNEDGSWAKKIQKDLVPNGPELFYSVTLEGKFSIADEPIFGDLDYPARAEIKVTRIISIDPIKTSKVSPDWKADSPIYDAGRSLVGTSDSLMLDLPSDRITDSIRAELTGVKITIERRSASPDDAIKFLRARAGKKPLDITKVSTRAFRSGTHWFARGTLTFSFESRSNMVVRYVSEYLRVENQRWKLLSINISLQK